MVAHYRILSLLGEGGMGQVYLAEDTKLHRKVSLKFLTDNFSEDAERLRRFEHEARAVSALNHPNILTIYEIGEDNGSRFIATEFIDGQTLRQRLRFDMDLDEAIEIAIQIASALVAAHRVNIVHRDIKPENIMIRTVEGLVKVLDFGLAKRAPTTSDSEVDLEMVTAPMANTAPGLVMGTLAYMSPEQVRGDVIDARTDLWSLGVVLYEMVAGCSPFVAGTFNEIISTILSKKSVPPLAGFARDIPERLQEIVDKALAKNRDERYQTSKDLLIDLKRLKQTRALTADNRSTKPQESTSKDPLKASPTDQVPLYRRSVFIALAVLVVGLVAAGIAYRWRFGPNSAEPKITSLAVLPFKSLDTSENYMGLGLADAVIRRISQTGELIVRPTSSVRRYLREDTDGLTAAKELGVDSVLEGTVQPVGGRLRVSVNLLRVNDGVSLWSESFDMRMTDVFAIQDSISQQVASRLQLKLTSAQQARFGKRYTSSSEAYEYYIKAVANFDEKTTSIGDRKPIDAAIAYFKKAIELDSKYALAYAQLGQAYMWMANFSDPDNPIWIGLAQQALSRAEEIDPQLAEIHSARFEYYFSRYGGWDLSQSAREARQALALNPSVGHVDLGTIYDHLGLDEATALNEYKQALDNDPTSTAVQVRVIEFYLLYGRFDEAIDVYRRFFGKVGPDAALVAKGRLDEAQPLVEQAIKDIPGDLRARARLSLIMALRGKFADAEAAIPSILQQAKNNRAYHHIIYDLACVYALAGKTDEAIKWLRTTAETGMPNYPLFARDPHLDRIRKEPAFIQFMNELKKQWEGYKREFE